MKRIIIATIAGIFLLAIAGHLEAAPTQPVAAVRPAVTKHQYPSDCFQRKVSYTLDYATGSCGWVPSGASFVEKATCRWSNGSRFTITGFRQWTAYRDSTAQCPGLAELVGAYIELRPS